MADSQEIENWLSNDSLFFAELEQGYTYSIEVARRFRKLGINATVPPLSKRIHVDDRDLYDDQADIVVPGDPDYTIEVKSRNLQFECEHDFPYETVFVDTVRGWDQKQPKPIAIVMVSRQTLGMAVIKGSTRSAWTTEQRYDNVRKFSDTFYMASREQLVGFGRLISFLRQRGRLIF